MPIPEPRYHLDKNYIDCPIPYGVISLLQIGRMHCEENTVVPVHTHLNWFELTLIADGRGVISTNGRETPVGEGDIHLSLPGDFHGIASDRAHPMKYIFFSFQTEDAELSEWLEELAKKNYLPEQRIFADERIFFLLGNAIAELNTPSLLHARMMETSLLQVVLYMIGDLLGTEKRTSREVVRVDELCYQMMNYIDTHLYCMRSLSEMAKRWNYSYSYLSNLFRHVTGDTLNAYYRQRRLTAAKLLLQEGKQDVGTIAVLLRYSSVYTFSRAFHKQFGMSPTEYRREAKKKSPSV